MSPGIDLSLHFWRGIGPDREPDLFVWRYRFGIATIGIERVSLLEAYRTLRSRIKRAIEAEKPGWKSDTANPDRGGV